MRGTKAKALRRACTTGGVLDKKAYREVKRGTGSIKRFAEKIIRANRKPAKAAKPLPVAPRAGAKPIHLVRAIQQAQRERGWDDGAPGHWWRDIRISLSRWAKCNLIWRLKDIKESPVMKPDDFNARTLAVVDKARRALKQLNATDGEVATENR